MEPTAKAGSGIYFVPFCEKSMGGFENLIKILVISLCIYLLLTLIKILHRLWWNPIRIQNLMRSQGITGPPNKFIHGSTREAFNMRKEAMSKSMALSHNIFPKVQPDIYSWINTYGRNYLCWFGSKAKLLVSEPRLVKEVMSDKNIALKKGEVTMYVKMVLGNGLSTCNGEEWSKKRKLSTYAFNGENLKSMIPEMVASVEMMLERWKQQEGKEIEVYQEFKLLTSEVISRTAFGSNYLEGKNIFGMLTKMTFISRRNSHNIRFPGISKFWRTADEIESKKLMEGVGNSVLEMIKKREDMVRARGLNNYGTDFLGVLMDAYYDTNKNKRISLEDLVDECKTFYIAGQETTTSLLAWTLLLLAIHTDWQEQARKEVFNIFGRQQPNVDGITKLKTISMIINETLRLYPPVSGMERKIDREVKVREIILPANITLMIASMALHHDPQIWGEDVNLFNPERFSGGIDKATNNNAAAFLPFGLGPRTCIGLNFATTEAKITLSMILQHYSFTLSPTYIHSPRYVFTLCPQYGVQLVLHSL